MTKTSLSTSLRRQLGCEDPPDNCVGEEKTGIPIEKIPNVFALDDFLKLVRER